MNTTPAFPSSSFPSIPSAKPVTHAHTSSRTLRSSGASRRWSSLGCGGGNGRCDLKLHCRAAEFKLSPRTCATVSNQHQLEGWHTVGGGLPGQSLRSRPKWGRDERRAIPAAPTGTALRADRLSQCHPCMFQKEWHAAAAHGMLALSFQDSPSQPRAPATPRLPHTRNGLPAACFGHRPDVGVLKGLKDGARGRWGRQVDELLACMAQGQGAANVRARGAISLQLGARPGVGCARRSRHRWSIRQCK